VLYRISKRTRHSASYCGEIPVSFLSPAKYGYVVISAFCFSSFFVALVVTCGQIRSPVIDTLCIIQARSSFIASSSSFKGNRTLRFPSSSPRNYTMECSTVLHLFKIVMQIDRASGKHHFLSLMPLASYIRTSSRTRLGSPDSVWVASGRSSIWLTLLSGLQRPLRVGTL
jgi:hypothetical protein